MTQVTEQDGPCNAGQQHTPDEHGNCDDCRAQVFNPATDPAKVLEAAGFAGGDAAGIAEGWIECDDENVVLAAWQHLHNTGLAYRLQGWFGRTAQSLIEAGHITA